MQKLFKIWVLVLITVTAIFLAFMNRYTVYPQDQTRYDRWTGQISSIKMVQEKNDSEKRHYLEDIEDLKKLKDLWRKSVVASKEPRINFSEVEYRKFKDKLDNKTDSLFNVADSLHNEIVRLMIYQRLRQTLIKMNQEKEEFEKLLPLN